MDRLAAQGARFDRFFVSPLCAPTRASLLTGRYHLRTGVSWVTHRKEVMRGEEVTLAEVFREAGYATGCFGKWHNGAQTPTDPNGQGFGEFVGIVGGGCAIYFDSPEYYRNCQPWQPETATGYITDFLTEQAIDFIRSKRRSSWLCYVPYNAPHTPCQVPDRYFDKYRDRGFDEATAAIYGMIENIDDNLGRLLEELDKTGQAERTVVVFLTDNGPNGKRYNGGMRGTKGSVDEGGTRVPCFVRYPARIEPGTVITPLCAHIDVLPTLAELCGVPLPANVSLDGVSLAELLTGQADDLAERSLFFHNSRSGLLKYPGAVRTPRWRAARRRSQWELHDMQADPKQQHNVAAEYPHVLDQLEAEYARWYAEVTDGLVDRTPVPVGHPDAVATELRTPESYQEGEFGWPNGPGYTTEWIRAWRSSDDRIWWELDVVQGGRYEVSLVYACEPDQTGSVLRIACGDSSLDATIDQAFAPNVRRRPDRRSDVDWKLCDFTLCPLGDLAIPAGRQRLTVQAVKVAADHVCEFRGLVLRKQD
jgi:arylsulfatase A